jgi:hypothetical protein
MKVKWRLDAECIVSPAKRDRCVCTARDVQSEIEWLGRARFLTRNDRWQWSGRQEKAVGSLR